MTAAGLPVDLTVHGVVTPHPPGLELAAYRIVQEALTNCLKHAGATHAAVRVSHEPDAVAVTVTDNGRGQTRTGTSVGHGLVGMRERVAVYGGELAAGPDTAGGFRVEASFPLSGDAVRPMAQP